MMLVIILYLDDTAEQGRCQETGSGAARVKAEKETPGSSSNCIVTHLRSASTYLMLHTLTITKM
jgi:hypothetical protein